MKSLTHIVTTGALLHDIGKVIHRAEKTDGRSHSVSGAEYIGRFTDNQEIIDCVRFHHKHDISQATLNQNSLAYAVYIADNISSGADRRDSEGEKVKGFDRARPLESIFNLLNNNNGKDTYEIREITKTINYPINTQPKDPAADYSKILAGFTSGLSGIYFEPSYINSLLELCEAYLSYVPASTHAGQVSDISLYDHAKTTAALSACIALYLESRGLTNYRDILFKKEKEFYDEHVFGLLSLDISGIQSFIYTISSKGALKGLRSRSFYLEILLENIADELLSICSLSRANLLYTGGGHAYILLPNIPELRQNVDQGIKRINHNLIKHFGARLFVAYGFQPCTGNELMSRTNNPESYTQIFRSVSAQIAAMKLRRYSSDDLRMLNSTGTDSEGRECVVCGISRDLTEREGRIMCGLCAAFIDISGELIEKDTVFAVTKEPVKNRGLPLFSADGSKLFLQPVSTSTAQDILKNTPEKIVRIYSKNEYRTGLSLATKLWTGDYAAQSDASAIKTFIELAESSDGIKRIGVLRADVDNLGKAFVSGFVRENDKDNSYKYVTISRTSTLSRNLSIFFKYYINTILEKGGYSLTGKKGKRNAVVVYAGGDDMFIVGAWDEVLSAAVDIRRAFARYSGGILTMSAGFAVYDEKYPISRMARETAELEKKAKDNIHAGGTKNSISLFGLEIEDGRLTDRHTYDWDTFENKVLGEKFGAIKGYVAAGGNISSSFLYNIIHFARQAEKEKINIARLAYLLARHEPGRREPQAVKSAYSSFSANLYRWVLSPEERRQLITALIIYVYTIREAKGERENE